MGKKSSAKGMVVTREDSTRYRRLLRVYSVLFPLAWVMSRPDILVPASGYMLIASAKRTGA